MGQKSTTLYLVLDESGMKIHSRSVRTTTGASSQQECRSKPQNICSDQADTTMDDGRSKSDGGPS
jgi:hypothetical protein